MRVLPILPLVLAAPLSAQTAPSPAPVPAAAPRQPPATIVAEPAALLIAACDTDADGKTTRAELTACIARGFAEADAAHAGSIGYIGYSEWALKWLGDRNALPSPFGIDTDGDNRITLAELQAQFGKLFDRFDLNRDGAATRAELVNIRSAAVAQDGDGQGQSGHGRGRGRTPGGR